ncbi:MAG: hypothetical protein WB698_08065 [Solirubrobacteraceae bacterium]
MAHIPAAEMTGVIAYAARVVAGGGKEQTGGFDSTGREHVPLRAYPHLIAAQRSCGQVLDATAVGTADDLCARQAAQKREQRRALEPCSIGATEVGGQ